MTVETMNTDLEALAVEFLSARSIANSLRHDVENPQCGKPGFGFKAARKKQPDLEKWTANQVSARLRINDWINRNRPSQDRKKRRMEMVNELIPGFFEIEKE